MGQLLSNNVFFFQVYGFCKIWTDMERSDTSVNPLSANPSKWSNTLKQYVQCLGKAEFTEYRSKTERS